MTFPPATLKDMLEWIGARLGVGDPVPTDEEIAAHYRFDSPRSAASLLADLADSGAITIRGSGASRVITLGRKPAAFTPAPRPTPSVVKRAEGKRVTDEDETVARISAILARGKSPASQPEVPAQPKPKITPVCPPAPVSTPAPASAPGPEQKAEGAQQRGPHRDVAAPQPIHVERGPKLGWPSKQLNMKFSGADYDRLDAMASAAGILTSAYARDMVLAVLNGETSPDRVAPERFRLPASVSAAAIVEGRPVLEFAAELLEAGLAAHNRRWSLERCA